MASVRDVYGGLEYTRDRIPPEVVKQRTETNLRSMMPYVKLQSTYLNATSYYKQTTTGKIFGINSWNGEFDNPTPDMVENLEKMNAPGGMEREVDELMAFIASGGQRSV